MSEHPSRRDLERMTVDDLSAAERDAFAQHVGSCPECRNYIDQVKHYSAAQIAAVPPEAFLSRMEALHGADAAPEPSLFRRMRWVWAGLAAAAATAVALFALIPALQPPPQDSVRFKGSDLTIYRKRAESTRVISSSDRVRAGDALRLVLHLDEDRAAAVYFIDAAGKVDPFYRSATGLGAGEHELPQSAVVDAPCRDLWILLLTGSAVPSASAEDLARLARARDETAVLGLLPRGAKAYRLRCE